MKKIAITQRIIENNNYYEIRDCLDINWAAFLSGIGFLPIILPSEYDFNIYFNELKIDGIILSGGNDLSFFSENEVDKKRDKLEYNIINYAIEKNIPLLGVCRGMQIVGNYFGMKLEKVDDHVGNRHKIIVNRVSKYWNMLKENKEVNSYHNYAFKKAVEEFIITAKSGDSVIEAMEHKEHKIFLQMWHPEREEPFSKEDQTFIKNYFGNIE